MGNSQLSPLRYRGRGTIRQRKGEGRGENRNKKKKDRRRLGLQPTEEGAPWKSLQGEKVSGVRGGKREGKKLHDPRCECVILKHESPEKLKKLALLAIQMKSTHREMRTVGKRKTGWGGRPQRSEVGEKRGKPEEGLGEFGGGKDGDYEGGGVKVHPLPGATTESGGGTNRLVLYEGGKKTEIRERGL